MLDLRRELFLTDSNGMRGIQLALTGALLTDGEATEVSEQLLEALQNYMNIFEKNIKWIKNPDSGRWSQFSSEIMENFRSNVEQRSNNEPWEIAISGGNNWKDSSEYTCEIIRTAGSLRMRGTRSYVYFALPTDLLNTVTFDVPAFVTKMATIVSADSGWAGYGLVLSPDAAISASFQQSEYATARRFEGLDVGSVAITSVAAHRGIKGANWLTVLGRRWIDELGGRERLHEALDGFTQLHDYGRGVIIQAGQQPVLGDRNRGETADVYRRVGHVLAQVRTKTHGRFHKVRGPNRFDAEATLEWLGRFDQ